MIFRSFIAAFLLQTSIFAGNAVGADKNSKILFLAKIQGLYEMVNEQYKANQTASEAYYKTEIAKINIIDPQLKKKITEALEAFVIDLIKSSASTDSIVTKWAELYSKQVTEKEVDQIIKYYQSPIGQKDVLASKVAMSQWAEYIRQRDLKYQEIFTTKMQEKMNEVLNEYKASNGKK
jgi:hypothetical protein